MFLEKTLVQSRDLLCLVFSMVILALIANENASADITESIENALKFDQDGAKYGQIKLDLRYRYEQDDTKNPVRVKGDASTIRLRLGYLTPELHGLQGFAEYETNQDFGANTYNSARNGKGGAGGFETIVDPQEHELNQLWISFKGILNTEIKVGRQRIKLDNDRFIGNVGWRQLEQTYDAILVTNTSLDNTIVKVGYINQSQTIHSFVQPMQTPFANISYHFNDYGKLTGYSYLLDNNENHALSNQTYGISFDGGVQVTDDFKALYRFEYAYQKDHEQNPNQYEVDYFHFMGGASVYGVTAKVGLEQLNGKGVEKVFQTPLATGHAFNGWSDQFLTTPAAGLRDIYGLIAGNFLDIKLMGVYHDFDDDTGGLNYGKEWNFLAVKKFGKHYTLLAKYAYFDGDNGRFDAQNFWFQAGVSF